MDLAVEELRGLESVWHERKSDLEAGGELADFLLRLKRDWAIETGIVERLYDWERRVTEVLIEQGVSASLIAHSSGLDRNEAEHARAMIEDHLEIVNWLFEVVKGVRPITEHLIRSLHQMFARHQDYCEAITTDGQLLRIPLVKDAYKNQPNNPRRANGQLHEYCPPELVSDEMQRLVAWHDSSPHGYTTDSLRSILSRTANGRVARALASLVFLRSGTFPLVVRKSDTQYNILHLERADAGDLRPLITFFAQRQKESILAALASDHEIRRTRQINELISSSIDALAGHAKRHETKLERVFETAEHVRELAREQLSELSGQIDGQLAQIRPPDREWNSNVRSSEPEHETSRWFYQQIIDTAHALGYWANLEPYRSWVRLGIRTNEVFYLVVAIHGFGRVFRGVLVASAFTFRRVAVDDDDKRIVVDCRPSSEPFQFNYAESLEVVQRRFRDWLTAAITVALEEWRRSIG